MRLADGLERLNSVFRARSVALVGLSANARKLNGAPFGILKTTGFSGEIYPVNPKYREIEGHVCYPCIADLPETPDVAVILVPAREVPVAVEECGRKGIHAVVVISSGFEEVGHADTLVARLKEVCRRYNIALVGPNCEGVWSVRNRVLLTFGSAARREQLTHSPIAILSQSGSLAGSIARHLQDNGFGCAYVVSVGNETVLGILDYLEYMITQDDVRVVLLFVEGLKDGTRLVRLAEHARSLGIVIVVLKTGNSQIGRQAVASHTGKIATPYAIYRDIFEQAGVLQVDGLIELIEAAELFVTMPLPRRVGRVSGGVSIYSIPGGTRALTVDLCEQKNVPLAVFDPETVTALECKLPEFAYARNPTDITGQVLSAPELFDATLAIVAHDPSTQALLIQLANRGPQDAALYRNTMRDVARSTGIPVIVTFLGDTISGKERRAYAEDGLFCARDPGEAVRYLSWLFRVAAILRRAPRPRSEYANSQIVHSNVTTNWAGSTKLLADAGISMPRWALLKANDKPKTACAALRFPIALKALPEDAEHKTERGLLRLNLADEKEVENAAATLRTALRSPDATLLMQEMITGGVETVLTVMRNDDFGAVLAIGSGGVLIELMRDIGYVALPTNDAEIERVIARLTLGHLLEGFRGSPPCDREALVSAAIGLTRVFGSAKLQEIEINPLIVLPRGKGVIAVDVLVKALSD